MASIATVMDHGIAMSEFGYKATRWSTGSHVRLHRKKPTIAPTTAAHNDRLVGNVRFAIRKPTFASVSLKGRCGSECVIRPQRRGNV